MHWFPHSFRFSISTSFSNAALPGVITVASGNHSMCTRLDVLFWILGKRVWLFCPFAFTCNHRLGGGAIHRAFAPFRSLQACASPHFSLQCFRFLRQKWAAPLLFEFPCQVGHHLAAMDSTAMATANAVLTSPGGSPKTMHCATLVTSYQFLHVPSCLQMI